MSLSSKNVFPLITITTTWILFFTQPLLQTRSLKIIHILGKWNMIINYDDYLHGLINQVILITLRALLLQRLQSLGSRHPGRGARPDS